MARIKPAARQSGKPARASESALEADDLQRWLEHSRSELGSIGITANFGRAPRIGGEHGPTWVSMTSPVAHGRLVRSPDGVTTITAHALPSGAPLIDESHPHTTVTQLEAFVAALGAREPTAGRA